MAKLIEGFKKIYSLSGYKISDKRLNKYIPYKYLKESIESDKIVFVSPRTWRDPYEQIYYKADYFEKYGYKKPNIFCMCLTENLLQNEDAAWKMYQNETYEKIIKVTFNMTEMLSQLDTFCQNEKLSI